MRRPDVAHRHHRPERRNGCLQTPWQVPGSSPASYLSRSLSRRTSFAGAGGIGGAEPGGAEPAPAWAATGWPPPSSPAIRVVEV